MNRLEQWLGGPAGPWKLAALALLISLPALSFGFQADDYMMRWQLEHGTELWRIFYITPRMLSEGRDNGGFAWWASPHLHVEFFRPLSSLLHVAELTLWPESPSAMLLINALVYAASVLLAARLYRRLLPSAGLAALAGLMFAIDDAHAQSVGWISGRNTLNALFFSLLALELHVRARAGASRRAAWLRALPSTAAVALALASAEAGVWALALLIAYALVLEDGALFARVRSIAPSLAVGASWALLYVTHGYGAKGTSLYRSLESPLAVLVQGVLDLPLWIASLFGPSVVGMSVMVPEPTARLVALPFAVVALWLAWPALVARSSRACRFFAVATALCVLPVLMTVPSDRVLPGASFGAFGCIACAIAESRAASAFLARVRAPLLIGLHVVLALALYVPMLGTVHRFETGRRVLEAVIEPDADMVLIASPIELLPSYVGAALQRAPTPAPMPRSLLHLYSGTSELWLERSAPNALDVTVPRGWGFTPIERIFCDPRDMPKLGDVVDIGRMRARVLELAATGMPKRVRFEFPAPLESRVWLIWKGARPQRFTPPALGERVHVPALSMFEAMPN